MASKENSKHKKVSADLFAKARNEFGFTYESLAERIGITGRHAQHVEYGDRQPSAAIFLRCLEETNPELFRELIRFIRTPRLQPVVVRENPPPQT
jgi:transcriptional regulator with XRE-family HTH domain